MAIIKPLFYSLLLILIVGLVIQYVATFHSDTKEDIQLMTEFVLGMRDMFLIVTQI